MPKYLKTRRVETIYRTAFSKNDLAIGVPPTRLPHNDGRITSVVCASPCRKIPNNVNQDKVNFLSALVANAWSTTWTKPKTIVQRQRPTCGDWPCHKFSPKYFLFDEHCLTNAALRFKALGSLLRLHKKPGTDYGLLTRQLDRHDP